MTDYLNDPRFANNASVRIFKEVFEIDMPMHFLYEPRYLAVHNPMMDEDGNYDTNAAQRLTRVRIPIAGIVDHYVTGTEMTFVNPTDTYTIYSIIIQHLKDWLLIVQTQFVRDTPNNFFVELRNLERLAEGLHYYAMSYAPNQGQSLMAAFGGFNDPNSLGSVKFSLYQAQHGQLAPTKNVGKPIFETYVDKIYNTVKGRTTK